MYSNSTSGNSIKTFYCNIPNAGDQLTAIIVKQLLNKDIVWTKETNCNLLGIGSILDRISVKSQLSKTNYLKGCVKGFLKAIVAYAYNTKCHVWSSGYMFWNNERAVKIWHPKVVFNAVRGKLTKAHIEKIYKPIPNVILADAGLLSSLLALPPKKQTSPIGIIPHWCELENIYIQELLKKYKNAKLINMRNDPLTVISEISSCETILSSSLHGLIIADSFGIANMPIVASYDIVSQRFKYEDYYSTYDLQYVPLELLEQKEIVYPSINSIVDNYKINYSTIEEKQKQLLACFPKELL